MAIEITHVRYGKTRYLVHKPFQEQTISHFKWRELSSSECRSTDKQSLAALIEAGSPAFAQAGSKLVAVEVVEASPKFLRSLEDGMKVNYLTSLPEF